MRAPAGEAEHVLVVGGIDGLALGMRRGRRRRWRARTAAEEAPVVPVTRLTVIRPNAFADGDDADSWLGSLAGDPAAADPVVAGALGIVNRALHAHRLATQDPHGGGVSATLALVVRLGYGTGDELADGRWTEARVLPPAPGPRRRAEALRPQERMAAELGRREAPDACETLILRARADLDAGRERETALQLRVGLEALLAEVSAEPPGDAGPAARLASDQAERQVEDLAELAELRGITGDTANEALAGGLSDERVEELGRTLRLCERVLRRRRVLAS